MNAVSVIEAKGNCFSLLYEYMDLFSVGDVRMVHGLIVGRGPIRGWVHGHAWIEINDLCVDMANGLVIKKADYYEFAQVQYVRSYTIEEFRAEIVRTGHTGPWDEEIVRINNKAIKNQPLIFKEGDN